MLVSVRSMKRHSRCVQVKCWKFRLKTFDRYEKCFIGEIETKNRASHHWSRVSMQETVGSVARGQREGRLSGVVGIMVVKIVATGISCKNDLRIIIRLSKRDYCATTGTLLRESHVFRVCSCRVPRATTR